MSDEDVIFSEEDKRYATKEGFLNFPKEKFATTILSMGPPASGKTHIMLECLKYWLSVNMFEVYVLILPNFKNEMNDSYAFLNDYENVYIYESFHQSEIEKLLIGPAEKEIEDYKKGKLSERPLKFFAIDDATSQAKDIFSSKLLTSLITQNRHYGIHSWLLCHYDKGVLGKKVRQNIYYIFLYPVKQSLLKCCYEDYIDCHDFPDFDSFEEFWTEYVKYKKYGSLLLTKYGKGCYNPEARLWFAP
jgi:hypothetical protein